MVERAFGRLKQWRDLPTHYPKRGRHLPCQPGPHLSLHLDHMIDRTRPTIHAGSASAGAHEVNNERRRGHTHNRPNSLNRFSAKTWLPS